MYIYIYTYYIYVYILYIYILYIYILYIINYIIYISIFDHISLVSGWWLSHPSEKYDFVSWGDEIPNIWKVINVMFQATNQL